MRSASRAAAAGAAARTTGAHATAWPIRIRPRVASRAQLEEAPPLPASGWRAPRPESLPLPQVQDSVLQVLCAVTGMTPADAELASLLCPEAPLQPRAQLEAHWGLLLGLLQVEGHQVAATAATHPLLLLEPAAYVQARVEAAAAALQLPQPLEELAGGRCNPHLLHQLVLQEPDTLVHKVSMLAELLGVDAGMVQAALLAEPRVWQCPDGQLAATLQLLERLSQLPAGRLAAALLQHPRVLMNSPATLQRQAQGLQAELRLSPAGLAALLRLSPAVVGVQPQRAGGIVALLAARMDVSREEAQNLVLQEPGVLLRSPGALSGCLEALAVNFRLEPQELLQVVEFDPTVLLDSPGQLGRLFARFGKLAHANEAWARQFRVLMASPANVARARGLGPDRIERLAFLAWSGRARNTSLRGILTMGGSEWRRRYPKFADWQGRAKRRRQALADAKAAAKAARAAADARRSRARSSGAGGSSSSGGGRIET